MEDLFAQLLPILGSALVIIAGFLGERLKSYLDLKMDAEKQSQVSDFVKFTVAYVNQIGIDLNPEEKFALAKDKVIIWASDKGITVSEMEVDVLIEAFVNGFKREEAAIENTSNVSVGKDEINVDLQGGK